MYRFCAPPPIVNIGVKCSIKYISHCSTTLSRENYVSAGLLLSKVNELITRGRGGFRRVPFADNSRKSPYVRYLSVTEHPRLLEEKDRTQMRLTPPAML